MWHDLGRHEDVWGWKTEDYTVDVTKTDNADTSDIIQFGSDIEITDISRSNAGDDVILNINNPHGDDDQITILNDTIEHIKLSLIHI